MNERDGAVSAGVTAAVMYLIFAGPALTFISGVSDMIGLPPVVYSGAFLFAAVGFPVAILLAVAFRPSWLRMARQGAAAVITLHGR